MMEIIIQNWLSLLVSLVVGQIFLTLWFSALFGNTWAREYGPSKTKEEHTREVPGYTYAIGALCTLLSSAGVLLLSIEFQVQDLLDSLVLGAFTGVYLVIPVIVPGYLFLKKPNALLLVAGSQSLLMILHSMIHYLL